MTTRIESGQCAAGIDRRVFLTEVVLPLLQALGLTRHDLPRVPAEAVTEIDGPPGLLTAAARRTQ
jgi:hypothetical protein